MVDIINRLLNKARQDGDDTYRLLVCAPTNKAISLLARRFVQFTKKHPPVDTKAPLNIILLGDADKLLPEHGNQQLQSIFLYTWVAAIVDDYTALLTGYQRGAHAASYLIRRAHELEDRLNHNIPDLSETAQQLAEAVCTTVESLTFGGSGQTLAQDITELVKLLKELPTDKVYPQVRIHDGDLFLWFSLMFLQDTF